MNRTFLCLAAMLLVCAGTVGVYAGTTETSSHADLADQDVPEEQLPVSLSVAYAGENVIHPGALLSLNGTPVKQGIHEMVLSASTVFFVFPPYYASLLVGARAQYKLDFPFGLGLRVAALSASYKHKVMRADVYTVENGDATSITDLGYGNLHVLATTGVEYDFADISDLPFAVFTDLGISAEPYFGVFKFHLELYVGMTYHLRRE